MQDLISYLHGDGLLTRAESTAIRRASKDLLESTVRVLRSLNVAAPQDIQRCFKVYFNIPLVTDTLVENLTSDYAALVPVDIALLFGVFGFGLEGNRLHVAMEDPTDRRALESLKFFLNKDILPAAANVYQLCAALERLYGVSESESGLQTVLDRARGAGAWSQQERLLFERIMEERRLREAEDRKARQQKMSRPARSEAPHARAGAATAGVQNAPIVTEPDASTGIAETAAPEAPPDAELPFDGMDDGASGSGASALDALQGAAGQPDFEDWGVSPGAAGGLPSGGSEIPAESLESLMAEVAEIEDLPSFDEDDFDEGESNLSGLDDLDALDGLDGVASDASEAAFGGSAAMDGADASESRAPAAEVSRLTLSSLTQKALLKSALLSEGEQVVALVNDIFSGIAVRFTVGDGQPVLIHYAGQEVSADDFKSGPWSTLGPLIRMLEKKCQSKVG